MQVYENMNKTIARMEYIQNNYEPRMIKLDGEYFEIYIEKSPKDPAHPDHIIISDSGFNKLINELQTEGVNINNIKVSRISDTMILLDNTDLKKGKNYEKNTNQHHTRRK